MAPRFQIITDTATYTHGDTTDVFAVLGHDKAVLEDYKTVGDWVDLSYSGGLTYRIPEVRIQGVAETA